MSVRPVLAVIPARGGSKGLPGKNVKALCGIPLIEHTIRLAALCAEVDRAVVSTEDEHIARVAEQAGGDVPFRRSDDLARDDTPMLPVIQDALRQTEALSGRRFESVLLLDPTSPGRLPEDVSAAIRTLEADPDCDGVIGVSEPDFNPYWHCVVPDGEYMRALFPEAPAYAGRQELPPVFRINASLYLWRRDFIRDTADWREGRLRMHVIPEDRAVHIDTPEQFAQVEHLVAAGALSLPWLARR